MMSNKEEKQIHVVLDIGTQTTKAGFAGESFPRCVIPSKVGRYRSSGMLDGLPDVIFGDEAIKMRGVANINSPIHNGFVSEWDDMEKFLHHIFYKGLHVPPEETKIMFSIHPLTSKKDKEKITEILFESFMVQGIYLGISPALVLYASGRTTGVVWENGYSCSYSAPVFEGFPLKNSTVTSEINGNVLTCWLRDLMAKLGYCFNTPAETDILESIKAQLCYVASDYESEMKSFATSEDRKVQFKLPDGQHIFLGDERFLCPEALFQPHLLGLKCTGIVNDICSSIKKCDLDYTSLFYNNIVLSGGTSLLRSLPDRLSIELGKQVKHINVSSYKVDAMPSRDLAAWIGGSIMASLTSLDGFWMMADEYEDAGSDRIAYKLSNVVQGLIALAILFTYPLQFYVPVCITWPSIRSRFAKTSPIAKEQCYRILLVLVTFVLAESIPNVGLFISLVGAISSTALALIFPPIIDLVHVSQTPEGISMPAFVKNLFILLLGLFIFVTGTYQSVASLIRAFGA